MRLTSATHYLLLCGAIALLNGCAAAKQSLQSECLSVSEAQEFLNSRGVGRAVTVCGRLSYEFENKNLYDTSSNQACIPVGIKARNEELLERAKSLSGTIVVVSGKVDRLVAADEVSFSYCKDYGIGVATLTAE